MALPYVPVPLPPAVLARPIAHRGLHALANSIIENTKSAFDAAIASDFGIECDLQASADGEAMVFHDFTLDRLTTAGGRTDNLSADALKRLDFKTGADGMGTLAELFAQTAGKVALVVEVKSRFDGDDRLAARTAALARDYTGPLVFKSFDPAKITALRQAGIRQPIGIIGEGDYAHPEYAALSAERKRNLANLLHIPQSRPDFLSWNHKDLPAAGPFFCRTMLGLPVMSWTIRSAEAAAKVAPHIDQIVFEGFRPA
jgi:glycerophosphoryl diester phosphodiesterase